MNFAVDIGNTNIVLGCLEGSEIKYIARMSTDTTMTDREYAVKLKAVLDFDNIDYKDFEGVVLSSVVPPITQDVCSAIKLLTGHDTLVVGAGVKTGLNILLDDPAQLGGDLVIGAVAALDNWNPPMIIIDMGTATTFSVIDKKGGFLGGAITPGVRLSLNALASGTSQLPKIPIDAPKKAIGRNSIDSMKSGAVFGTAAMIDGMIDRFEDEIGCEATVIATGGLAKRVIPYCKHEIVYDGDLLLKGLGIIWNKNKKQ